MLKCPSCDHTLEQDFGMVTCGSCGTVLMIDITGQIQTESKDNPLPPQEPIYQHDEPEITDTDATMEAPFHPPASPDQEVMAEEEPLEAVDEAHFSEPEGESFPEPSEENFSEPEENFPSEEFQNDEILTDNSDLEGADFIEPEEPIEEPTPSAEPPAFEEEIVEEPEDFSMPSEPDPNPVDITSFANSEESNLEDGELVYDVTVARIDSKEQRESLKYVLMDEKLKLNYHEFMKKIKDGKVTIPDLNPIKAKRIVEQLQFEDLDIKWKQKRVIIETVEPELDSGEEGDIVDEAEI